VKEHAIIPIFLPHRGCPNDCVFCNQKEITAKMEPALKEEMIETIEKYMSTLSRGKVKVIEIAFFGGSFTGMPMEEQNLYLKIAKEYKDRGMIHEIRLSTRPDYIGKEILENLKRYGVDTIELGAQSFHDEVLSLSNRGHISQDIRDSAAMIKDYGFKLGIQLMIGLPGDTYERAIESAEETIKLKPDMTRIYPTITLRNTALAQMYFSGEYKPFSREEILKTTKDVYKLLVNKDIKVIRVGLKSSDLINEENAIVAGDYHPAFRQMVEAELFKEKIEEYLEGSDLTHCKKIIFYTNEKNSSNIIGHRKSNKQYFEAKYKEIQFEYKVDPSIKDNHFEALLL
jgi:radical SAM enzyme (TIGR01210 family)